MKLTCDRAAFSSAFSIVASAVPSRTPRDVLRNVFLSVGSGGVELVGTDQETAIRFAVSGVETSSEGEVLLPTQRVSSILRELQAEQFEIEVDEQSVTISAQSSRFRLSSEDPREFPPVAEFSDESYFRVAAPVFRQMVRRTSFATDTESTRYALGGLLLEIEDGQLTLAATDSRRLAVASAACDQHGDPVIPERTIVIPTRAMALLEKSIDPAVEFVDIALRENDVMMRAGTCVVYSRLVEGRFPRYRDVIPASGAVSVALPVGMFLSAVRQAQIITDEESRGVDFQFAEEQLSLSSEASTVGDSRIDLPSKGK